MVPVVEDISVLDDPLVKPCVSVICDVVEKLAVVPAVSDDCVTVGTLVVMAGAVVTGVPVDSDIVVPEVADDCVTVGPLVTVAGSVVTGVPEDGGMVVPEEAVVNVSVVSVKVVPTEDASVP